MKDRQTDRAETDRAETTHRDSETTPAGEAWLGLYYSHSGLKPEQLMAGT